MKPDALKLWGACHSQFFLLHNPDMASIYITNKEDGRQHWGLTVWLPPDYPL